MPGRYLWGFFTPPVAGADLRAALVASCLRGALWVEGRGGGKEGSLGVGWVGQKMPSQTHPRKAHANNTHARSTGRVYTHLPPVDLRAVCFVRAI